MSLVKIKPYISFFFKSNRDNFIENSRPKSTVVLSASINIEFIQYTNNLLVYHHIYDLKSSLQKKMNRGFINIHILI